MSLPDSFYQNQLISAANYRRDIVVKMRESGISFGDIGKNLGISTCRASQIYRSAENIEKHYKSASVDSIGINCPISQLPLRRRTCRALQDAGFSNFYDLILLSRENNKSIGKIPGIGKCSLKEISKIVLMFRTIYADKA
ncbi:MULTISPECIES: hypothetical protein [unclassified Novosphingobium]|uniref:hypothetical protein n=1 Tax=unclassified Novosphingobium TaxID=2644732 RepID=UPI00146BB3D3|nr:MULTISPECIES: hypothetical protein [unclassified Novosphingobium]NMN04844.1 hypothetical protein [Novosphingobium sp. SG919]NMN85162.1 hypothetical protein [Novosphingobium sp. SG916]